MRTAIGSAMMLPIDDGHDGREHKEDPPPADPAEDVILELAPHGGAPLGDAQGGWVLVHADYLCLCSA